MAIRYGLAMPASALLTLSLLVLMQYLIHVEDGLIDEVIDIGYPEIVHVQEDTPVEKPEPEVEPPPPVDPPPPTPQLRDPLNPVLVISDGFKRPDVGPPKVTQGGLVISDGGAVAILQARPIYPDRARRAGLEGYVVIEFIVTALGTVRDAVVVESSHRYFDKPALQAIYKSRYRPQYRSGVAVESPPIRKRFSFKLDS